MRGIIIFVDWGLIICMVGELFILFAFGFVLLYIYMVCGDRVYYLGTEESIFSCLHSLQYGAGKMSGVLI